MSYSANRRDMTTKISDLPILDMTKEEEFDAWWARSQTKYYWSEEVAKQVWSAAWCCARLGQWEAAKAEASAELEAQLWAIAGQAFNTGHDDQAKWFRALAKTFFKNDKTST